MQITFDYERMKNFGILELQYTNNILRTSNNILLQKVFTRLFQDVVMQLSRVWDHVKTINGQKLLYCCKICLLSSPATNRIIMVGEKKVTSSFLRYSMIHLLKPSLRLLDPATAVSLVAFCLGSLKSQYFIVTRLLMMMISHLNVTRMRTDTRSPGRAANTQGALQL